MTTSRNIARKVSTRVAGLLDALVPFEADLHGGNITVARRGGDVGIIGDVAREVMHREPVSAERKWCSSCVRAAGDVTWEVTTAVRGVVEPLVLVEAGDVCSYVEAPRYIAWEVTTTVKRMLSATMRIEGARL
eukprot:gnl/TRDRNA2_/TRDRNA2_167635_c0_seq4.p2 gnl/TRDRNA2_/TRDRNA2_167635_c0~~gnl/TRDRNA2_/TRDRNA2_167635_c0_seq4.p2  ORF type:complete len:133 (-),score=10.63 gnl/TRDRNA2_/TRDRNA2_167635_c0_seq4:722-1120(-)